jgi:fungal type III polyketide synthase
MRAAAEIACGAPDQRRPARVLAFACELCTLNVRCNLDEAAKADPANVSVAGVLFSDAASAFVLCNDLAMEADGEDEPEDTAVFQLMEWENTIIPKTIDYMGLCADPNDFRTILTRDIFAHVNEAVQPMYEKLLPSYKEKVGADVSDAGIDWALHPEGDSIIVGVQEKMRLSNEQLRATKEIYKARGNSLSPTTVIVLDKLCHMGKGKDHVIATVFGPGFAVEMSMLRRCRASEEERI